MSTSESTSKTTFRPRFPLASLALAAAVVLGSFAGCSDDGTSPSGNGGGDGPPRPFDGRDGIVFRVFVEDALGQESLRWVGDPDGPGDSSPETTSRPYVPFGRPFRVEWEVDAAGAPVTGTRVRVFRDELENYYIPFAGFDDAAYDDSRAFRFANQIAEEGIDPDNCGTGPYCYGDLRFDSGSFFFEVESLNGNGRVIDTLQTLRVEVNYPPRAVVPMLPPVPALEDANPTWSIELADGGVMEGALAPGDTIPSGATVRVLVRGEDRLDGATDPDSLCCDVRLDEGVPELRFQGRTLLTQWTFDGLVSTAATRYGPATQDSVLEVYVGPGDYELELRTSDEHGRRSEVETFRFVAGYPPQTPRMDPPDGAQIVLLPPDRSPPLVGGEPAYAVRPDQSLYFLRPYQRWSTFPDETVEYVPISGAIYRIPLRFFSDPHPAAANVSLGLPVDVTDIARSFAYELVSEFDPGNSVEQGPGDRLDAFIRTPLAGSLTLDELDAIDFDGFEIFVPNGFFGSPELFADELRDPEDPPVQELFAEMATRMRRDLGVQTFRAQAMTTNFDTRLDQRPPLPDGVYDPSVSVRVTDMASRGRLSPLAEQTFTVRIQVDADGESIQWPLPSDSQAVALEPERD